MAKGHIEDGKCTIAWNLPRLLLPKNRVKLLLNMLVIAQQTIPRGGTLTVDPIGEGESMGFKVAATGLNARLPQNIADLLGNSQTSGIDAHAVQPYYTRLLAEACGLKVSLKTEGEAVVATAS
jgi:histidine phosphotransferase ChpT